MVKMNQNEDFVQKFEEEYEKVRKGVKKPNVLLAGQTGAGKSSIVNMIFGENVAVVGTGKPVTQDIDVYESDDCDVRIFDSKGYEIGEDANKEFYDSVVGLAKQTNNPENIIHIIWYCIPCNGARVTDYDLEALKAFHDAKIPTAVVFTKADLPSEEEIKSLSNVLPEWTKNSVFETSTNNMEYNHVDDLIAWSVENLSDERQKEAFIKSQQCNLKEKWKLAHALIAQHAAMAFGVGFVPIPCSDAPLLIGNEIGLLARIVYLYDLGSLADKLKTMGISVIIGNLLSIGGKTAAGALLKLIPGIGTVLGGAINGSVGALITAAFGEATSAVSCEISKVNINGNKEKAEEMMSNFVELVINLAKEYIKAGKKSDDYKFEDL